MFLVFGPLFAEGKVQIFVIDINEWFSIDHVGFLAVLFAYTEMAADAICGRGRGWRDWL